MEKLVQIKGVSVNFYTYEGVVRALNNLSLDIYKGETLGLVGETGCGKTMTAFAILRLIMPPGVIETGTILFTPNGSAPVDLLSLSEKDIRAIRGSKISMVFQEPGNALNPVYTIGDQISEVILLHRNNEMIVRAIKDIDCHLNQPADERNKLFDYFIRMQKYILAAMLNSPGALLPRIVQKVPLVKRLLWRINNEAKKTAVAMLKEVDIPDAERIVNYYPHQLSGGMKQRAVIAMALACSPKFLIADEPTTALDVTIQAQILELLQRLKDEFNSSVLYITHDLGVAAAICDRVGVMYGGSIVELAEVNELFVNPLHPYTRALLAAVPKPGEEPMPIPGFIPDPTNPPAGCPFHPRCSLAQDICRLEKPELHEIYPGHFIGCHIDAGENIDTPSQN
ncbi:MAG: ABC transporter ATP-binding protein [Dehalococcoidaceae bacterium]|nr:ABC transporter ATP-binding protein [Dehalococcoidaceae bacterium]